MPKGLFPLGLPVNILKALLPFWLQEDSQWLRKITSGHRMVGGEEEDYNDYGRINDRLHEKKEHRSYGRR